MSIRFNNVTKTYRTRNLTNTVFQGLTIEFERAVNVGILGRNGAGKSTLLRLIAGAEQPDKGSIARDMSISWPLGFGGFFQNSMTGLANAKFCCRIYGADPDEKLPFVRDFASLGKYFDAPVKTYSTGMRARLGFALCMAIDFDCILIDEVMAVGDAAFRKKCQAALDERRQRSSIILVSHSPQQVKRNCDKVIILKPEGVEISGDVKATVNRYQKEIQDD